MSIYTTTRSVVNAFFLPRSSGGMKMLPHLVFALSLATSLYFWHLYDVGLKNRATLIYNDKTEEIAARIIRRMHENEQVLRGAAGLFNASSDVTRLEWQRYCETLKLGENYPGILGVGFSQWVEAAEKDAHIRRVRSEGFSDYTIRPEGVRPAYTSIIFLEPFDLRNQRAFGFDMFSEPVRRAAMEKARDSAATAIAAPITLVQETGRDIQAGLLMYVPVYRYGMPSHTAEERRAALLGFVYSPIRINDFVYTTLGKMSREIAFNLYASDQKKTEVLLFSSVQAERTSLPADYRPVYHSARRLDIFGRSWLIEFSSLPPFSKETHRASSRAALAGGILVSCLLTMISFMLLSARDKALAAALSHQASEEQVRRKLTAIIEPEGDLGELKLADILDRRAVQAMMDDFYRLTGIGIGIIDLSGTVLVGTGWQDICVKFHRVHPETARHCIESDTQLSRGVPHGTVKQYRCGNNLWDLVTPIVVGGDHIGNIFLGQFFYEDETPDYEFFRQQARRYGFSEKEYLAALDRVPRWSREKVATVLSFYAKFADMIANLGYGSIRIARSLEQQKRLESERVRMEQQLLNAQKLESLGVLAGGIAHDFNNILMAIIGNADLALMRLDPESPLTGNLNNIVKASNRAAELAKQMLDYSGKGMFAVEMLDLNCLLRELRHMLEVSISKNALLQFKLHEPLPAVKADATQMRQIIMNLVINASEAIGDANGVITISTGCITCDSTYLKDVWLKENITDDRYVCLEVADTGCGMDQEVMTKIFDPFFSTKFTGRGLGMAAVLGIVRSHRGAVKISSEPGTGSCLTVLLPAGTPE